MKECIVCNRIVDLACSAFEQRLIEDKDFCRECWDEMMEQVYPEEIPHLIVDAGVRTSAKYR